MSVDETRGILNQPIDDSCGKTSTRSASGVLPYIVGYAWPVLKTVLGAGGIVSLFWAAYTYSAQEAEQRRQDFLQAFDVVDTHIAGNFLKLVTDTIKPIANTKDEKWWTARSRADNAHADLAEARSSGGQADLARVQKDQDDEQVAVRDMQAWILKEVLVKGSGKDDHIHNYQNALNTFRFLYSYASADPCNAAVVVFKFQKAAYDFLYYFPGGYDFSGPGITAIPRRSVADGPEQLADDVWGSAQVNQCAKSLKLPSLPLIQQIQQRIFAED